MQEGDRTVGTGEREAAPEQAAAAAGGGEAGAGRPAVSVEAELDLTRRQLEATRGELEKTRRELEHHSGRLDEVARAYSALVSDQKEFRGRLEREKTRVLENERGKIAHELLEIGDELDRALAAASGDEGPLAQGVRMIREGLIRRLTAMGIERLSLVGQPFDPNVAEAVDLLPVQDPAQDDRIVAEFIPGYRLGDRILRPARVRVARYLAPAQPQPAGPDGQGSPPPSDAR